MTIRERMALALAAQSFPSARARENEAYWQIGLTPPSYHAMVLRVLDREDAEREMPAEVHRLRRLREKRAAARSGGRVAPPLLHSGGTSD